MKVEVVPYDPSWPQLFIKYAAEINTILGDNCIDVLHIGSTSVPGLSAKPIIDIIPVVKDIFSVNQSALESYGYVWRGESGMMFRGHGYRYTPEGNVHLHIWEQGHPEIEKHMLFAQHLRKNPEDRKAYEDLKLQLAKKYEDDPRTYSLQKDNLVRAILAKTGFKDRPIVEALLEREWQAYHSLLKENIYDPLGFSYDESDPKFKSEAFKHYVLSLGVNIIGAAQLDLTDQQKATLRGFAIEPTLQNQGHGAYLLQQLERWLKHQGYTELRLKVHPDKQSFYESSGYSAISPFEEKRYAHVPCNFVGKALTPAG